MVKAKKFVYARKFHGHPKRNDFEIVEEELPPLKNGEYLCEAVYLSVDPYMRVYMSELGSTMIGAQIAKITESKSGEFRVGQHVCGNFGWRSHTISSKSPEKDSLGDVYVLPDFGDLPLSLGLGVLGMTGNTAYFGLLEICQPRSGETVVVSGAAGAVGSIVGQIAKIKGCKVIGIAGSDAKCLWLTKDLGFDAAINYKKMDVSKALKEVAPKGIDCYFDNVGGEISSIVIYQMNQFGRVAVCGSISVYNNDTSKMPQVSILQPAIVSKQLKIRGFNVLEWADRWFEGITQNLKWIQEGKLKYHETITTGFDNMFNAFSEMMSGANLGKAIVQAKP